MSLIKILPEYLETFSLKLHPKINYLSSSYSNANSLTTGSMPLSARPSRYLKNLIDPAQQGQNSYDPNSPGVVGFNEGDYQILEDINNVNKSVIESRLSGTSLDVYSVMDNWMGLVGSSSQIGRNTKRFEIVRFDPPFTFTKNSTVKNITRNVLMPNYISQYDMCQFGYTNYHTLNFFTGSGIPDNSAIVYSNMQPAAGQARPYSPSGSFTVDFWVNPRYTNDVGKHYHAGTLLHLSSTMAVSLISGSRKDENGSAATFRILLQLKHSAGIPPHTIDPDTINNTRSYPEDLVFVSESDKMFKNHWHHVSIRWGGKTINDGTGSIYIDNSRTDFSLNSGSILPDPPDDVSSTLVVGNFLNWSDGIPRNEALFFNDTTGLKEGVYPLLGDPSAVDPENYEFANPLNAEIHDLKIFNKFAYEHEIKEYGRNGRGNTDDKLLFYLPPYFVKETRTRDALITPFQTRRRQTPFPFNYEYSFGVGGFMINLQNYLREFKNGYYPRLINLTASTIDYTVLDITANQHSFGTASMRKRNLTVLPNDNGLFSPDFSLLLSGTVKTDMSTFKHVLGGYDLSMISVNEMVEPSAAFPGLPTITAAEYNASENSNSEVADDESNDNIANQIAGVTPTNLGGTLSYAGPILTVYQRTRDPSSNEVCFFDISNIFYGNKILPESFYLTDPNLSGSGGKIKMTLRDNGKGGLYRADALTPHPKWANVGTVLYNEGIAVIKSPHLSYFGKDEFEAEFKGEQNTHILTINMPAGVGLVNSSSNPSYKPISASLSPNEYDPNFVYLSGFYLHDDNLNVIMRGNIAQPVKKRQSDEMVVKFKVDF